jgi:hypothetical protein
MDNKKKLEENFQRNAFYASLTSMLKVAEKVRPTLKQHEKMVFNRITSKLEIMLRESEFVKSNHPLHLNLVDHYQQFNDSLVESMIASIPDENDDENKNDLFLS